MERYIEETIGFLSRFKETFERAAQMQTALWNGERMRIQPLLLSCILEGEESEKHPILNMKEIHWDSRKMLASQLRGMVEVAYAGAESVPSVRANMGCGIFPTLLGVKQELFDDKMPWVQEHLSREQLKKMGPEDLKLSDEFKAGLEHMAFIVDKLEGTGCLVFPMDLQGPMDVAHLVYGDAIFYDLYDDPDFVHHLLDLSCEAIIMGMEECLKIIPGSEQQIAHYNCLVIPRNKGGIKISEDTSTLLSKDHVEEFVVPHTERVLSHFGGGYIHYCGHNEHLFNAFISSPLVIGLNLGNPEKHDMEYVLGRCRDTGKVYYGVLKKDNNESFEDYFTRLLACSSKNGVGSLLLQYRCRMEEREEVLDAWRSVCSKIYTEDSCVHSNSM